MATLVSWLRSLRGTLAKCTPFVKDRKTETHNSEDLMNDTVALFCLVHTQGIDEAFEINIDKGASVSTLKKLIKSEKAPEFDDLAADRLTLWVVTTPIKDEGTVPALDHLKKRKLRPRTKIVNAFDQKELDDENLYVVVEAPVPVSVSATTGREQELLEQLAALREQSSDPDTKELRCIATYGRKSPVTFQWTVRRESTILASLKGELRVCFDFPEGTEDQHIIISRDAGNGRSPVRLLNDTELGNVVWGGKIGTELAVVVDTAQQPFSSWTFAKMKDLFGLNASTYEDLPPFQGGTAEVSSAIRDAIMGEWMRRHTASATVGSANEATRCEFIASVLYGVASLYGGTVKVYPQYELSGSHGKGPIDWVIKAGDTIIMVTEAKKEDINQVSAKMSSNPRPPSSAIGNVLVMKPR